MLAHGSPLGFTLQQSYRRQAPHSPSLGAPPRCRQCRNVHPLLNPAWPSRRYDVVCPFKSAFDLSQAFPEAEFVVCGQSGHSAGEDEHTSELVMACDRFAGKP